MHILFQLDDLCVIENHSHVHLGNVDNVSVGQQGHNSWSSFECTHTVSYQRHVECL